MPIMVRCPECDVKSQYSDRYAGQTVACKSCGEDVDVPAAGSRGGGKKSGKGKKSSSSSNVLVIVGVLGGLAVLGIVGAVGLFLMLKGPGGAANAPQPVANAPTTASPPNSPAVPATTPGTGSPAAQMPVAKADTTPNTAAKNAAPTPSGFQAAKSASTRLTFVKSAEWSVTADAPAEPVAFASQKPLKLKLAGDRLRDDALIYPVTASEFVGIRQGTGSRDPVELYNLTTGQKEGTVPGTAATGEVGLSPDGKYFAASSLGSKSISVYDVKAKKPLGELATADAKGDFRVSIVAIPRPDRLVGISQLERGIKVWELPSGNFLTHIVGEKNFHAHKNFAFSPGGRYIAVNGEFLEHRIEIYDLTTGKLAGSLAIENKSLNREFAGFAFSPDGTEFAAAYDLTSYGPEGSHSQFVAWKLDTGAITSDFDIKPKLKEQLDPPYGKERLDPFPNGRRWLAHGLGIIDRDKEALIFSFPKLEKVDLNIVRRPMGDDWLVGVSADRADSKLETITLDESLLAAAAKTVEAGGLAIDTALPPLTACDHKEATAAVAATEWKAVPDPGPITEAWKGPINIESGSGIVRDVALNRSAKPVVAARIAQNEDLDDAEIRSYAATDAWVRNTLRMRAPSPVAKKTSLETFNAASGERVSRVEIPFSGDLLAVSPNGDLALLMLHRGKGRLDVFNTDTEGKHVVGWRPYRTAGEERHRDIFDAAFIDDEHVVSMSTEGVVVVWKIDGMTPVFSIPDVNRLAVSPGGKTLAVVRGNSIEDKDLAFFDSRTGDGLGIITLDSRVSALAFHPNGKWLAMSHGNQADKLLSTIDVEAGQVETRFPVPDMTTVLQWTGDDFLLLGGRQLVSKTLQAVVWSYDPDDAVFPVHPPGGPCVFANLTGKRWQLRSAQLPQAELAGKLEGAQLAALALVKPGDKVALKVTVGNEPELAKLKVSAAEQAKARLEKGQLEVTDGQQPVEVHFDISFKSGTTAQLTSFGAGAIAGGGETVTQKIVLVNIKYQMGAKVLWETKRAATNFDRHFFTRQANESGQAAIDRFLQEGLDTLIGRIEIPTYIFGDKARNGLGNSKLASVK